jgi:16S rRNA (guanine527-N7)-methyltransferase
VSDPFLAALCEGANRLELELDPQVCERLVCHQRLLLRWAPKVNLTTVLEPRSMAERLYLDSAVVLPWLGAGRLHDVGSGAGFPGLVLKALRPELAVTLTEARRRKVSFLRQAAREMGLESGLDIQWRRLGWEPNEPAQADPGPGGEGRWDEVISRATFPPGEWIAQGAGLVAPGGRLWIMAGQPHGQTEEAPGWQPGALPAGLSLELRHAYRLPFCGLQRWLLSLRRSA